MRNQDETEPVFFLIFILIVIHLLKLFSCLVGAVLLYYYIIISLWYSISYRLLFGLSEVIAADDLLHDLFIIDAVGKSDNHDDDHHRL